MSMQHTEFGFPPQGRRRNPPRLQGRGPGARFTSTPSPGPTPSATPPTPSPRAQDSAASALPGLISETLGQVLKKRVPHPPFRLLNPSEQQIAVAVFGNSLDLNHIVITPLVGVQNRAFTVAVRFEKTWWVAMNVGSLGSWATPPNDPSTLVHELVHAWQSQHSRRPMRFMLSSLRSQAAAMKKGLSGGAYSAYAYVPGKPFEQYGAEQIAQQVEDTYTGRGAPTSTIVPMIRQVPAGVRAPYNDASLEVVGYEKKGDPGVIWR